MEQTCDGQEPGLVLHTTAVMEGCPDNRTGMRNQQQLPSRMVTFTRYPLQQATVVLFICCLKKSEAAEIRGNSNLAIVIHSDYHVVRFAR